MKNIYLDMDGVIVDFKLAFKVISGGYSTDEYNKINGENAGYDLLNKFGSNWWYKMPWTKDGKELYNFLYNNFISIKILSATGKYDKNKNWYEMVKHGKIEWLNKNIPTISKNDIIIVNDGEDKSIYSNPNNILIDDTELNIQQWKDRGGIGILHSSTVKTIKQLNTFI